MYKLIFVLSLLTFSFSAKADASYELGIGAGTSTPHNGDSFKSRASTGDAHSYWLGYGLTKNWGLELGLDQFDFDRINSKHKAIALGGVYRFAPENRFHPIAKLGLTSVESSNAADVKTNSLGAKAALGLEADFECISLGVLYNLHHITKSDDALNLKDTQASVPVLFLTFHNRANASPANTTTAAVPAAASQTPAVVDSDSDGVLDGDDKCGSTPAGDAVNNFGCSETEKASVKLNVAFASGKAVLDSNSNSEIENLANFMKKFSDTHVEIAGHTDNLGNAASNLTLSQKRADAVKIALVQAGVAATRITAKGYGSDQPLANNKTKAARDQNRRVTAEISTNVTKKK